MCHIFKTLSQFPIFYISHLALQNAKGKKCPADTNISLNFPFTISIETFFHNIGLSQSVSQVFIISILNGRVLNVQYQEFPNVICKFIYQYQNIQINSYILRFLIIFLEKINMLSMWLPQCSLFWELLQRLLIRLPDIVGLLLAAWIVSQVKL